MCLLCFLEDMLSLYSKFKKKGYVIYLHLMKTQKKYEH